MRNVMRLFMQLFLLAAVSVSMVVAQESGQPKRIGYVVYGASEQRGHLEQAFIDGMRDQGYVEGKNLVVERIYAESDSGRLRNGAGALAAMKLDAIVHPSNERSGSSHCCAARSRRRSR